MSKKKEKKEQRLIQQEKNEHDHNSQFHLVLNEWNKSLDNQEGTKYRRYRRFELNLFPFIGVEVSDNGEVVSSPRISDISHVDIMTAVDFKKKTAHETARRLLADCKTLWSYAIAYGYTSTNVVDLIPNNQRLKRKTVHYAKITEPSILAELLEAIANYKGHPCIRCALMLAPYVMLRAENLTALKWEYIDFDKKLLTIPREKMKIKDKNLPDFKFPLVDSAIKILEEIKMFTGWGEWVFHGVLNVKKHVDPDAINKVLRVTLGFNDEKNGRKQTLHSFRGTFRSLIDTYLSEHNTEFIVRERVLDHQEKNLSARAYSHKADYTNDVRKLLEWWEKYLARI